MSGADIRMCVNLALLALAMSGLALGLLTRRDIKRAERAAELAASSNREDEFSHCSEDRPVPRPTNSRTARRSMSAVLSVNEGAVVIARAATRAVAQSPSWLRELKRPTLIERVAILFRRPR